ncbi:MAG: hypothetical protein GY858_04650 [Candidatus Omnitrophica bacterium]|nr:hypothetical protein [Candidatus Omnitrophota bacterium]
MWLFSDYGFKIRDSEYSPSFGGEGLIRLENEKIRIDLISDRDHAYFEFSPIEGWEKGETVTYDIIRQLITNEVCDDTMISESQIVFLKANFPKIISLVASPQKNDLLFKIRQLERERAKRLFG